MCFLNLIVYCALRTQDRCHGCCILSRGKHGRYLPSMQYYILCSTEFKPHFSTIKKKAKPCLAVFRPSCLQPGFSRYIGDDSISDSQKLCRDAEQTGALFAAMDAAMRIKVCLEGQNCLIRSKIFFRRKLRNQGTKTKIPFLIVQNVLSSAWTLKGMKFDMPVRTRPLTETRFNALPINWFYLPLALYFSLSFFLHCSPASFLGNQAPPLPLLLWASTFLQWEQGPRYEKNIPPKEGVICWCCANEGW